MPPPATIEGIVAHVSKQLSELEGHLQELTGYNQTKEHLQNLQNALAEEFDLDKAPKRRPKQKCRTTSQLRRALLYARKKLEKKTATEKNEVKRGTKLKAVWIVRSMLASPSVSQRTLAEFCADFPGTDQRQISHSSIGTVRDAFALSLTEMQGEKLRAQRRIESLQGLPNTLTVVHVHDGVDMKLRTATEALRTSQEMVVPVQAQRLSRGQSCKVQNHSIQVFTHEMSFPWLTELTPLAHKDAKSIATSIIQHLEAILCACNAQEGPRFVVHHLLTGDAVNANEAAARMVLQYMICQSPVRDNIDYKLVWWRCASHKANLVVNTAITGRSFRNPLRANDICANLVRFFKYLTPFYMDDFASRLRQYIIRHAQVEAGDIQAPENRPDQAIRELYGYFIFPPEMMQLLNIDVRQMRCRTSEPLEIIRGKIFCLLFRLCLHTENKPVITRFWVFADCCAAILRAQMLGLPETIFTIDTVLPRERQQKRLSLWKAFYSDAALQADMKRACLCLSLTNIVVNLTAKKNKQEHVPTLIRIAQGEVERRTVAELTSIVTRLYADPALDLTAVIGSLVITEIHIFIRFAEFRRFPTQLWTLTKLYNEAGFLHECEVFLDTPSSDLDAGFSLLLQAEAKRCGNLSAQLHFLANDATQHKIVEVLQRSDCTSLDVERSNNQNRRCQKNDRIMSIARGSRNCILETFRSWREMQRCRIKSRKRECLKKRTMNVRALAIHKNPTFQKRGRGQLHWETGISANARRRITHTGDEEALQQYISDNFAELDAEAKTLRRRAIQELQALKDTWPVSHEDWMRWFLDHEEDTFVVITF